MNRAEKDQVVEEVLVLLQKKYNGSEPLTEIHAEARKLVVEKTPLGRARADVWDSLKRKVRNWAI